MIRAAVLLVSLLSPVRDDGQWANQPAEIRQWFQSVMQPGFEDMHDSGHSCCGTANAFDVEMVGDGPGGSIQVRVLNGKGIVPDGEIVNVPREKLQPKYGNPLDNYILFMAGGSGGVGAVYCLIPKAGI